jgi:hypothetical protein
MNEEKKMKVRGLQTVKPVKVVLDKYFDEPHSVTVKPLPVPARARIQELTTDGMRYATRQTKKALDIEAIEQAMPAEVTLEIRRVKLAEAYSSHDLVGDDGQALPWGEDLWNMLDDANPLILAEVLEAITELSYPDDEEDPTSPGRSGKK